VKKKNEIYKNAPLVETVFEITFPGEPAIECNRDKLYAKIRNLYSKVLVPQAQQGVSIALSPYRFEREDGMAGVMLSINKIAFYCKKYEGFNLFFKETMRLFSIFGDLFKIKKIKRTGLRYINILPFVKENGAIPFKNYFNIDLKLPKSIPPKFENLSIIFVSKIEGGNITTRIEPAISPDRTKEVIILDFDYAKAGNLNFQGLQEYLNESHKHTKYLFEELITEDYKKVMRGEVI